MCTALAAMQRRFVISHRELRKLRQGFHFFFFLFNTAPAAFGSSLARGQVRAAAMAYATAMATLDPSHIHDLQQC